MRKWIDIVDDGMSNKKKKDTLKESFSGAVQLSQVEGDCECDSYDCLVCYPAKKDHSFKNQEGQFSPVAEDDKDDDFDLSLDDEPDYSEPSKPKYVEPDDEDEDDLPVKSSSIDVGDEEDDDVFGQDYHLSPREPAGIKSLEDVDSLIKEIDQFQQAGQSGTDRHYDVEKLYDLPNNIIKNIHSKVVGGAERLSTTTGDADPERLAASVGGEGDESDDDTENALVELMRLAGFGDTVIESTKKNVLHSQKVINKTIRSTRRK